MNLKKEQINVQETSYTLPTLKCLRCGHFWHPRMNIVFICPKCKSRLFNVPKEKKVKK